MRLLTWLILQGAIAVFTPLLAQSQEGGSLLLSGTCLVSTPGRLHLYLVDEATFSVPMTGLQSMVIDVRAPGRQSVRYAFLVPPGRFGLRAFLDTNDNGVLDKGLWGPTEPWGMSWRKARPVGFPRFADICFAVDSPVECPPWELECPR